MKVFGEPGNDTYLQRVAFRRPRTVYVQHEAAFERFMRILFCIPLTPGTATRGTTHLNGSTTRFTRKPCTHIYIHVHRTRYTRPNPSGLLAILSCINLGLHDSILPMKLCSLRTTSFAHIIPSIEGPPPLRSSPRNTLQACYAQFVAQNGTINTHTYKCIISD